MNTLTDDDVAEAGLALGVSTAAIRAVMEVESRKRGFNPDGSVVTLFEGHIFCRYTFGRFSISHPELSYPKWTRQFYGKSWKAEQLRLKQAMSLDERAAVLSTSWGMFQIMGFNFSACGFSGRNTFLKAMRESETTQLLAFCNFVKSCGALRALRTSDWSAFARIYNGPGYKENGYDKKLASAYVRYSKNGV